MPPSTKRRAAAAVRRRDKGRKRARAMPHSTKRRPAAAVSRRNKDRERRRHLAHALGGESFWELVQRMWRVRLRSKRSAWKIWRLPLSDSRPPDRRPLVSASLQRGVREQSLVQQASDVAAPPRRVKSQREVQVMFNVADLAKGMNRSVTAAHDADVPELRRLMRELKNQAKQLTAADLIGELNALRCQFHPAALRGRKGTAVPPVPSGSTLSLPRAARPASVPAPEPLPPSTPKVSAAASLQASARSAASASTPVQDVE